MAKSKTKQRSVSLAARVPTTPRVRVQPGGMLGLDIDLRSIPPPTRVFSADAAAVQLVSEHKCVNIYFVSVSAVSRQVRTGVRVRFPISSLAAQVDRDKKFYDALDGFIATGGFGECKRPSLDEIDSVAGASNFAQLEGSFMALAFYGESAVCDVYAVPPDFVVKTNAGLPWQVDALLRVNLPTLVLQTVLVDIRAAMPKTGAVAP